MSSEAEPGARHEAVAFVIIGLLGFGLLVAATALAIVPPILAFSFVRRGIEGGALGWIAAAVGVTIAWLLALARVTRHLRARTARLTGDEPPR